MAKEITHNEDDFKASLADTRIYNVDINNEVRKSFLDYSMSVIVSRHFPMSVTV